MVTGMKRKTFRLDEGRQQQANMPGNKMRKKGQRSKLLQYIRAPRVGVLYIYKKVSSVSSARQKAEK